jgi:hypothetical protein
VSPARLGFERRPSNAALGTTPAASSFRSLESRASFSVASQSNGERHRARKLSRRSGEAAKADLNEAVCTQTVAITLIPAMQLHRGR